MLPQHILCLLSVAIQHTTAGAITSRPTKFESTLEKRAPNCAAALPRLTNPDCQRLSLLGFSTTGVNGQSSAANPIWIGDDGPYRADYSNVSGQDIVLVVWPSADSFVTSRQPAVTASLAAGDTITVSMLPGITGAWAGLYADTDLTSNGQIANTWGEFAAGGGGVVDVNRQYDMGGHFVSITTPGGCRSDLETCAFVCLAGESCTSGVELVNCDGAGTAVGGGVGGCPWGAGALRVELGV